MNRSTDITQILQLTLQNFSVNSILADPATPKGSQPKLSENIDQCWWTLPRQHPMSELGGKANQN